jgi:DNA mismatch endonuclease, patch repair protein
MRANRRVDTAPELALRSELHRSGLRFRKDLRLKLGSTSVRPDVVFTRAKVAVFVDGCFWHSCPDHGQTPTANRGYWEPKLANNVERDRRNDAALEENGWRVLRFYEHVDANDAARIVRDAVDEILPRR